MLVLVLVPPGSTVRPSVLHLTEPPSGPAGTVWAVLVRLSHRVTIIADPHALVNAAHPSRKGLEFIRVPMLQPSDERNTFHMAPSTQDRRLRPVYRCRRRCLFEEIFLDHQDRLAIVGNDHREDRHVGTTEWSGHLQGEGSGDSVEAPQNIGVGRPMCVWQQPKVSPDSPVHGAQLLEDVWVRHSKGVVTGLVLLVQVLLHRSPVFASHTSVERQIASHDLSHLVLVVPVFDNFVPQHEEVHRAVVQ
mmetsp:Transcript_61502/g.129789  ORF Transcript_61502/g.129789 Transcript_61502/m.129789 type:complete len:247 (+) Transcript_61502:940-1680(+)